jgi:effector-binding domain-containing protein
MKRKFVIIASIILILIFCFLFFAPIEFGIKKQISIKASIIDVTKQITDLRNWPHWNSALKNRDTSLFQFSKITNSTNSFLRFTDRQYTIVQQNGAFVIVKENNENARPVYHSLYAFSDSLGTSTNILWVKNVSPFEWIKEKINSSGEVVADLNSLKNFMEDPNQYYGFPIRVQFIPDSIIITKNAVTSKNDRTKTLAKLYNSIKEYAASNNIQINPNNPRVANYYNLNNDSVKITAGIPVSKKAPEKNDITYMEIPQHGRALVGYYEGDYAGLKKLYTAINKYYVDKRLQSVAAPYEKYLTNPQSAQDSLHMKIEIYYPVLQ